LVRLNLNLNHQGENGKQNSEREDGDRVADEVGLGVEPPVEGALVVPAAPPVVVIVCAA
jgi:hypothetical protein